MTDILQQFLTLEGQKVGIQPLSSGHINDTYKISLVSEMGDKADFVLQRLNTAIFPEPAKIMSNMAVIADYLKRKNYKNAILTALPTHDGSFFYQNQQGAWRLMPYVAHTQTIETVETPTQAQRAAQAFGAYLTALADLPVSNVNTIIPRFHDAVFRLEQFQQAHTEGGAKQPERSAKAHSLATALAQKVAFFINNAPSVPQRVTHNDTKISNILFDTASGLAVCVIDLDTVQPGSILSDFGDMVRTYTSSAAEDADPSVHTVGVRPAFFEALARGFLSETAAILTDDEKKHLIFGSKRTIAIQALRFLTDFLNGDTYYKTAYPDHNWVRACNQWALLQSLEQQEADFQRVLDTIFASLA